MLHSWLPLLRLTPLQVTNIEDKIKDLRAFLSTDAGAEDPEGIRAKVGELQQATLKVFELAYKKVGRHSFIHDGAAQLSMSPCRDAMRPCANPPLTPPRRPLRTTARLVEITSSS